MFTRLLKMEQPPGQSAFLWGPRKTGKSFYLRHAFPASTVYDFLMTDVYYRLLKEPHRLREELMALEQAGKLHQPVILDEVQKIPAVLDEVHWLIENKGIQFILCGSSARKLKRGHGNLLGGRAWRYEMHPLTRGEIPQFNLLRALNHGLIPSHYLAKDVRPSIKAYVQDYLREEIMLEGLVRNMPAFSRFLDALAFSQGELVNYTNTARDCGVDAKTVRGYYEILVDTLLGTLIHPFSAHKGRQTITATPKFYLFDVGVAGYLEKRHVEACGSPEFGRAFEHFIFMELIAYRSYASKEFEIAFWRTKQGQEVDFVLNRGEVAIEVKSGARLDASRLHGIKAFCQDDKPSKAYVVTCERQRRLVNGLLLIPWAEFLDELWAGAVV